MTQILDRPVWSALATRHAALALGGPLAKRYPAAITPLAAARDDHPDSLAALAELPGPGESLILLQADPIVLPAELTALSTASAVQMIARHSFPEFEDPRVVALTEADAASMLALALATKPGPFSLQAGRLGQFWGIKHDGRLVAMAGERLRQPGFAELSGLCTDPEFRGHGYGRLLLRFVAGRISARGDHPTLHAYATNTSAIALYHSIGFEIRCPMQVAVVARRG